VLNLVLLVLISVFLGVAVVRNWSAVRGDLGRLSALDWVLCTLCGGAALVGGYGVWSAVLRGMGGRLGGHDSRAVFFAGQLGKYVPGSVWPAVIQSRLAARHGVASRTMVSSFLYALAISVGTGGIVGLLSLTTVRSGSGLWISLGVAAASLLGSVVLLHPRGLERFLPWIADRTGRNLAFVAPNRRLKSLAVVCALGSWAAFGMHAWIIARALGAGPGDAAVVVGGFALAFVAGVLVLPVPGGAGVRELVLVLTIGSVIGRPGGLTLALISRFVLLAMDIVLALLAGTVPLVRSLRRERERGVDVLAAPADTTEVGR
jgi:glycosyltransferase 2 family protein